MRCSRSTAPSSSEKTLDRADEIVLLDRRGQRAPERAPEHGAELTEQPVPDVMRHDRLGRPTDGARQRHVFQPRPVRDGHPQGETNDAELVEARRDRGLHWSGVQRKPDRRERDAERGDAERDGFWRRSGQARSGDGAGGVARHSASADARSMAADTSNKCSAAIASFSQTGTAAKVAPGTQRESPAAPVIAAASHSRASSR